MRNALLTGILACFFTLSPQAQAAPFVCFGSVKQANHTTYEAELLLASRPQCEDLAKIERGLTAVALVLSATGFGLACTGIGAPATIYLEGSALGVQALSVTVGWIPCDNSPRHDEIKKLASDLVCRELMAAGIQCRI